MERNTIMVVNSNDFSFLSQRPRIVASARTVMSQAACQFMFKWILKALCSLFRYHSILVALVRNELLEFQQVILWSIMLISRNWSENKITLPKKGSHQVIFPVASSNLQQLGLLFVFTYIRVLLFNGLPEFSLQVSAWRKANGWWLKEKQSDGWWRSRQKMMHISS